MCCVCVCLCAHVLCVCVCVLCANGLVVQFTCSDANYKASHNEHGWVDGEALQSHTHKDDSIVCQQRVLPAKKKENHTHQNFRSNPSRAANRVGCVVN